MHGYKRWDEADRRRTMNPEAILAKAGLKPGMTMVDVGCGQGYFTIPAARVVGREGQVYGIDVDEEALEHLEQKASSAGLNVKTLAGEAESTVACEGCADIVFFGICLHDFHEPDRVLANAWRMLRPRGRLANLDWKKAPMEGGPPVKIRFSERKASSLLQDARFDVESVEDISGRYYLILARG